MMPVKQLVEYKCNNNNSTQAYEEIF